MQAYLDHAASTAMRPEAVEAMLPWLTEHYANPTGAHRAARQARQRIEEARDQVAEVLGVAPGEVVFCGTGTESDNLAIAGTLARRGGRAVTTAAEHHAVLHSVERAHGTVVGTDAAGAVDLDQLAGALGEDVSVVSVMGVNNEVGTITPMAEVARIVRRRAPGALLHCDAVQSHTWIDTRDLAAQVDALSFSGHKFGGPKGVGVLVLRRPHLVEAQIVGGGQEAERRSGTHNVAGIAAFATAFALAAAERETLVARVGALRDRLVDGLCATITGCRETVDRSRKVAGNAHVLIEGVDSESVLFLADRAGLYASAGSSCSSGAVQQSHVTAAMGLDVEAARGALRMSLGATTTDAEVDHALAVLPEVVAQLRRPVVRSDA